MGLSIRAYARHRGVSEAAVRKAIKTGRTFVTSGPVALARVDGQFSFGDEIPADGKSRPLQISAFSSGEKDDYLNYLILFRNGRIHQLWDLRKSRPRKFEEWHDANPSPVPA